MANNYSADSAIVKYFLYGTEFLLISIMYKETRRNGFKPLNNPLLITCFFIVALGMVVFHNEPYYSNLIKYVGYVTCFFFGEATTTHHLASPPKYIIRGLIILPLIIVAIGDHSLNQSQFFPNSNSFTYWGICCALLYYTTYRTSRQVFKVSIGIILMYIAVGSSLGILVAVVLSFILINRRNRKLVLITVSFYLLLAIGIIWSDISVFKRIRNVIEIYTSMTWEDWNNLSNLNLYELQKANTVDGNMRSDNTSSIWRFQHWIILLTDYISNIGYSFFIGLGDNYAQFNHRLRPHNDWLRLLVEYGFIVFFAILTWTRRFCRMINHEKIYYIFLAIIIYHITENLIDAFPANCMMYICAGSWYQTCKKIKART